MSDAVSIQRDGPVTTVLLSRPDRRNAVDGVTAAALADAFRAFDADPEAAVDLLGKAVAIDLTTTPKNPKLAECLKTQIRAITWPVKVPSLNTVEYSM